VPSHSVEVVDTTAAGDAFVGALAARLDSIDNLEHAVRYATAAGALACTRMGAQPSLPTAADVDRLLAS
jgi:ribokinase